MKYDFLTNKKTQLLNNNNIILLNFIDTNFVT